MESFESSLASSVKRITLQHVAGAANVSVATASRALRGEGQVADETRRRVLSEARRLGYQAQIRALPQQSGDASLQAGVESAPPSDQRPHHRASLLIHRLDRAFFADMLVELFQNGPEAGVNFRLVASEPDQGLHDFIKAQAQTGVDVMILFTWSELTDADAGFFESLPAPVILVNRHLEGHSYAVTLDDFAAGVRMARYLYDLGHRRIGYLVGNPGSTAVRERHAGFRTGLEMLGVYDPELFVSPDRTRLVESVHECVRFLLSQTPPPTALWTFNDTSAAVILSALQGLGVRVPEDLSVAGFDHFTRFRGLHLTTFSFRHAELARNVLHLIHRLTTGDLDGPLRICVVPELIEGATTGPGPCLMS